MFGFGARKKNKRERGEGGAEEVILAEIESFRDWDEEICLTLDWKKKGERAVRGRRDTGSSPLGQQCVFLGVDCVALQNITGHQQEDRSVSRFVSVCVCSETGPATHTPPSAAQESTFCFLCHTDSVCECV